MSGQERKQIYINEYTSLFYTVLCNFPPFYVFSTHTGQTFLMSKILHEQVFSRKKLTQKNPYNLSKFKLQQNAFFNRRCFNSTVFNIRLYKTAS